MDRFTRFKMLRALWARARALLAWLHGPQQQQLRSRAQSWQQVNIAERQIRDGVVRSTGDPDAYVRPQGPAQQDAQRSWGEIQREWYERQQRQGRQQRGR